MIVFYIRRKEHEIQILYLSPPLVRSSIVAVAAIATHTYRIL